MKKLEPWQERLLAEKVELSIKVERLSDFLGTDQADGLGRGVYGLLRVQLAHMSGYLAVLDQRIGEA